MLSQYAIDWCYRGSMRGVLPDPTSGRRGLLLTLDGGVRTQTP